MVTHTGETARAFHVIGRGLLRFSAPRWIFARGSATARSMSPATFRFAPSPNGRLHLGHAYSAWLNHDAARRAGGRFLVRMEDIDLGRCRPDYEEAILDDLAWLDLAPDAPPRRQSEHFDFYREALTRLEADGLVYPTFESRAEIARAVADLEAQRGVPAPRDPDGALLYPFSRDRLGDAAREELRRSGAPFVLRLDMAEAVRRAGPLSWQEAAGDPLGPPRPVAADPTVWGDVVLARKDIPASYHLAVVMDDALQGITHVVRGLDLFHATGVHRVLQRLLGLPAPRYHHHRLILDTDGRKLSKSRTSPTLADLRARGADAREILARLAAFHAGRNEEGQATPST